MLSSRMYIQKITEEINDSRDFISPISRVVEAKIDKSLGNKSKWKKCCRRYLEIALSIKFI